MKLPVMNGDDATRAIRKFNINIPIIAQTAYAMVGDREKALDAGCNDFITKPLDSNKLKELVEMHL
jgi:CheY-like chemotaxis protein